MLNIISPRLRVLAVVALMGSVQTSCGDKSSKGKGGEQPSPEAQGEIAPGAAFGPWTVVTSGTGSALRAVTRLPDGKRFLAVGDGGTALISNDTGKTWVSAKLPTTKNLTSIYWVNKVVMVGGDDVILTSTDGGSTWSAKEGLGVSVTAFGESNVGEEEAFVAVGRGGAFLRGVVPGSDINAFDPKAMNWTKVDAGTRSDLTGVYASFSKVMVFGTAGYAAVSRDGGKSFRKVDQIATSKDFLASGRGVAVGDSVISREKDTTGFPAGTIAWSTYESSEFPRMDTIACIASCTVAGVDSEGRRLIAGFADGYDKPVLKVEATGLPARIRGISTPAGFAGEWVQVAVGDGGLLLVKREKSTR